jgi:hypothetical protein
VPDDNPQLSDEIENAIEAWEPELTGGDIAAELEGDYGEEYLDEHGGVLSDITPAAEDAAQGQALIDHFAGEFPSFTTPAAQEAMAPIVNRLIQRGYDAEDLLQPEVMGLIYQQAGGEQKFARIAQRDQVAGGIVNAGPPRGSVFTD